jgi:hypothetical protein
MGNSPADLAAAAGHSTKMLLDTYAKPTGRLKMPTWACAAAAAELVNQKDPMDFNCQETHEDALVVSECFVAEQYH